MSKNDEKSVTYFVNTPKTDVPLSVSTTDFSALITGAYRIQKRKIKKFTTQDIVCRRKITNYISTLIIIFISIIDFTVFGLV